MGKKGRRKDQRLELSWKLSTKESIISKVNFNNFLDLTLQRFKSVLFLSLEAKKSMKEHKAILHSFKKAKSIGPDGWEIEFYLGFYDFFEEELLRVIEEYRISGKVLGALNAIFIDSIPKKYEPRNFDDYKPISLCNSVYKIITNILANKLKGIFFDFILENQIGFLINWQIHKAVGAA
jgi:hypothetical protein